MRRWLTTGVFAAALLGARVAHADDEPLPKTPQPVAAVAAFVPGLLFHGSGPPVLGETPTWHRLVAAEGVGLLALVGGGATFRFSGASRGLATTRPRCASARSVRDSSLIGPRTFQIA